MSSRTLGLSDSVIEYLRGSMQEPDLLRQLRAETAGMEGAGMQISPEQGRFMAWLVRALQVRRCLEVGVFTGYSSLSVALALPAEGSLVACDIDPKTTEIARRYWELAGVASKIELHLGPAVDTLDRLLASGGAEQFDFAFVDADKASYPAYYERVYRLLRVGGAMLFDNALWGGRVAATQVDDPNTSAIREVNARAVSDERLDTCLVPIGDGLLLTRKL